MKTYQELCALSIDELRREPCQCVSCTTCAASGTIRVPYDDFEICSECVEGIVEVCDRCHLLDEFEVDQS
jgi:hypothetical protein